MSSSNRQLVKNYSKTPFQYCFSWRFRREPNPEVVVMVARMVVIGSVTILSFPV